MRSLSSRLPVSVVIPAFDAEAYIRAALESVLAQTCTPAEIVVVDDASRDRTAQIAEEYGARIVRFARNRGPAAARNAGALAAGEPWIAFLDADDVWRRDKLAAQWEAIGRWPDAGFCFTDYDVAGPAGEVCRREMACDAGYAFAGPGAAHGAAVRFASGTLAEPLTRSMFVRQSSVLIRRELVLYGGGYDESLRLSEDYDFFLRRVCRAPAIAIERSLVVYRRRERSLSVDPLAEVASIDRLWAGIIDAPGRYPPAVLRGIERHRPALLRMGCRLALRLGRFGEAISFARRASSVARSPGALLLLGIAFVLNNAAGRTFFRGARALWRLRSTRWSAAHAVVQRTQIVARHEPLFP